MTPQPHSYEPNPSPAAAGRCELCGELPAHDLHVDVELPFPVDPPPFDRADPRGATVDRAVLDAIDGRL